MGAWGHKSFENDTVMDWTYLLEDSNDLALIEKTLNKFNIEYLEEYEGCPILGACEIILTLHGKGRVELPEEADKWVKRNQALDATYLNKIALSAIDKILSEESELFELWEDNEDWLADVKDLKKRFRFK
jgi:hypothetical protein